MMAPYANRYETGIRIGRITLTKVIPPPTHNSTISFKSNIMGFARRNGDKISIGDRNFNPAIIAI